MKNNKLLRAAFMFFIIAIISISVMAASASAEKIVFMTGSPGGSWQAFGGIVKNILASKMPDIEVSVLPGGAGNNVMGVEMGKANMGLSASFISVDAQKGNPPFKKPTTKIRHLLTVWPQWYHLMVTTDSGIKSVSDLRGKKIATLKRGSAGETSTRKILSLYGLSYEDLAQVNYQGSGSMAEMMIDGHIDACSSVGPVPASYYTQVAETKSIQLISIKDKLDALHKLNPGYIPDAIPAGSYRGVDEDVPTASLWVHIIVPASMDEALAYRLTKTFVENYQTIRDARKGMAAVNPQNMARDVGLEYHPGAKKYFKEAGLIK